MKNLKKLLAVVVAVTVLLSAMVPAFAAAEYNSEAEILKDLGLYAGVSTTSFDPALESTLKREDGVIMLEKALGVFDDAKAMSEADVATELAKFSDANKLPAYAKNAVAYAVKNNLVVGVGGGKFGVGAAMAGKDFATIVLKALGYQSGGVDFTAAEAVAKVAELAGQDLGDSVSTATNRDAAVAVIFTALSAKAKGKATTVIADLVASGDVTEAAAKASGLYTVEALSATVAQTAGNKLTVTFNTAVDTAKATFEVKKGSVKVNTKAAAWDEAKKVATLEAYANLSEGDYTVAIGGLDMATKSLAIAVKASTVTKIEFLSDKLVKVAGNVKQATVGYKVTDQFGADVTKANTVTVSASVYNGGSWTDSDGSITVETSGTELKVGDPVAVTVIHPGTAKVATATLTVAAEAKVASISLGELKNKDNKVLRTSTNLGDDVFKFEATVKDQYGNVIDNVATLNAADQILKNPSNTALTSTFVKEDDKIWLKLTGKPSGDGTYTITLIALSNGANAVATVKVEKSIFVDSFTMQSPVDQFIENETLYVPFTAVDQYGNALTKHSDIEPGVSLSVSDSTKFDVVEDKNPVDGTFRVKLTTKAAAAKDDTVVVTAIANNKISTVTLKVVEEKRPVRIDSVKADVVKKMVKNGSVSVDKDSFVVKDNYDRDIALGSYLEAPKTYWIKLESNATDKVSVTGAVYSGSGDTFVGGNTNGAATITAKLMAGTEEVANGSLEFTMATIDKGDITAYEIGDIGTVYSTTTEIANEAAAYRKDVKIYGKTASGDKVALDPADIKDVRTTKVGTLDYSASKVYSTSIADRTKDETITVVATVAGKDGAISTVTKSVTVSGAAKVAGDIAVKADNTESFKDNVAVMTRANINAMDNKIMSSHAQYIGAAAADNRANVYFEVKDQYGVASAAVKPAFFTISVKDASGDAYGTTNYGGGTYTINSTTGVISVANAVVGDEITVTAITIDGKQATVKIIAVQ